MSTQIDRLKAFFNKKTELHTFNKEGQTASPDESVTQKWIKNTATAAMMAGALGGAGAVNAKPMDQFFKENPQIAKNFNAESRDVLNNINEKLFKSYLHIDITKNFFSQEMAKEGAAKIAIEPFELAHQVNTENKNLPLLSGNEMAMLNKFAQKMGENGYGVFIETMQPVKVFSEELLSGNKGNLTAMEKSYLKTITQQLEKEGLTINFTQSPETKHYKDIVEFSKPLILIDDPVKHNKLFDQFYVKGKPLPGLTDQQNNKLIEITTKLAKAGIELYIEEKPNASLSEADKVSMLSENFKSQFAEAIRVEFHQSSLASMDIDTENTNSLR